jgi:hypothetical protein
MLRFTISVKNIFSISIFGLFFLLLSSCGTYNQTNFNEEDGIYKAKAPEQPEQVSAERTPSDSYYKQYFNSKTQAYDALEQGTVFTDIEAYSTTGAIDKNGYIVEEETQDEENYGAWGENSKELSITIYNNNNIPYWNRPYWWYGSGWGYSNNWCSPFSAIGYGWGYPYYGYYGWGYPYYYGGYYNNYNNSYYGNQYNGYAYSRGRRSSDYYNGRSSLGSNRSAMRDAARGVSIARTKNTRKNSNNFTTTRNSRNLRSIRSNQRKEYARNIRDIRTTPSTYSRSNNTQSRNTRNSSNTSNSAVRANTSRANRSNTSPTRRTSSPSRSSGTSRPKTTSKRGGRLN